MSRCKWMTNEREPFDGLCLNDKCPMIADYCPLPEHAEFCMYSETPDGAPGSSLPTGAGKRNT